VGPRPVIWHWQPDCVTLRALIGTPLCEDGFAMRYAIKLILPCIWLVSHQAFAGAVLNTQTREYHVDPPAVGTTRMFADGSLLRIEINSISSEEDGLLIFRGDRDELIVADNEHLEYFVIDERTMEQMARQMSDTKKEMQAMLESMPPEERAEAEQLMQEQMPGLQAPPESPSTLRKTGESDTINGYNCVYYEVLQDGRKTRDMCVAAWGDIEGGDEAVDAMLAMGRFFQRMHDAFSESSGTDFMGEQQEVFAQMRELGGYPVYARDYDELGALEGESTLESSRSKSIDAAMFAVPEGYRRGDMY
jgi:hypothetical protein